MVQVVKGRGVKWGNFKNYEWEDGGTLGNIRKDYGNHHRKGSNRQPQAGWKDLHLLKGKKHPPPKTTGQN